MQHAKSIDGTHCAQRLSVRQQLTYTVEALERRVQLAVTLSISTTGSQSVTPLPVLNASDDATNWQSEMSVAVNPVDPLQLAGVSYHNFSGEQKVEVIYSTDGGASWGKHIIDGRPVSQGGDGQGQDVGSRFDPVLTFDDEGRLFVAYGFAAGGSNPVTKLIVGRSIDGGENFDHFDTADSEPGIVNLDKFFMTSGKDAVGNPAIYIAYSSFAGGLHIAIVGCNDLGGTTFDFDDPVIGGTSGYGETFACPAVGPNGELYVSWYDAGDTLSNNTDKLYFDQDLDGLWGTDDEFGNDSEIRQLVNGRLRGYTAVKAQPDRGINTAPVLTADRRPGSQGRLYLAFVELADAAPSQDANVKFAYGTLNQTTQVVDWTFLPAPIDSSTGTEFNPWVDVDQATGTVHVLYYTTDGDQTMGNEHVKMRMATSLDSGSTWSTANITSILSDEYENGNNVPGEDSFVDYLEYIGLDVHQGTAHALFAFEPFGAGADHFDLDSIYVNSAFVNAGNTLTIAGTSSADTIEVQHPIVNSVTLTNYLEVRVNNVREFAGRIATVGKIVINGLNGNDTITVGSTVTKPTTINGGDGNDSITGGGGADVINGGGGDDVLVGGGGDDTIRGSIGADALTGGLGSDRLEGEDGNDTFWAADGIADLLFGGNGTDIAWSNDAIDTLDSIEGLGGPPPPPPGSPSP